MSLISSKHSNLIHYKIQSPTHCSKSVPCLLSGLSSCLPFPYSILSCHTSLSVLPRTPPVHSHLRVFAPAFHSAWTTIPPTATWSVKSGSEVAQSCPTLCDPMDCSPPGTSIHGLSQARILEWVAISSSRGSSWPRDQTQVSCIAGRLFTVWATREVTLLVPLHFL